MQYAKKRIIALIMVLAMLLSLMPTVFAADAPDFPDMPAADDPAYDAVKQAIDNGLLTGENGRLNLEDIILRSTISKIVASAFGAEDEADLSAYTDVAAGKWYTEWLAKADQMGIMHGSGGKMRPGASMTRQEAYAVLSRALNLGKGSADDLKDVKGAGDLAAWAVPEVAPLVKAGYVTDLTAAGDPITRGEFVQVMHNIFSDYISEGGTVTEVGGGSVIVNVPDVTLKDCTVKGDLVIADGVGDGDVTLDNVSVEGRLVVRGGGLNSIHIVNNSKVSSDVVVTKVNGNVRVYADATSGISMITVADGRDDVVIEGTVGIVTVANTETPVVLRNATVVSLEVTAPSASVTLEDSKVNTVAVSAANATVELAGKTTVAAVQVDSAAEGVTVNTGADTRIETLKAGADVTVDGDGEVGKTEGEGKVANTQGEEIKTTPAPNPAPSEPQPSTPAIHVHVWATEWSKNEGIHWHACTVSGCTAQADATPHSWTRENTGEWSDCICGKPYDGPGDADHEHTFDSTVKDPDLFTSEYHWLSCTHEGCDQNKYEMHTLGSADGQGYRKCTKCNYKIKDECASGGHKVTTWAVDTYNGNLHKGTCEICGETMTQVHTWGTDVTNGKVACTAGCGATQNVSGTPHTHHYSEWFRCENSLSHQRICRDEDCNHDGAATQTEFCTDDGTGKCGVCGGAMTTEEVPGGEQTP